MKTLVPFKNISLFAVIFSLFTVSSPGIFAQSGPGGGSGNLLSNGLSFSDYTRISGTDKEVGAIYLFKDVTTDVDAWVSIDSLVNGARINKIDDNGGGIGYKSAFQPEVKSGGVIGSSYAVFTISFYKKGTNIPAYLDNVNATALDIDGNLNLKEFAEVRMGNGGTASYMGNTTDLSLLNLLTGKFMGMNILGIERDGIDTTAFSNMYTSSNNNISSFSVKYGTATLIPTSGNRQFSLYMKGFNYPNQVTLPLELMSYAAMLKKNTVQMNWITMWEKNLSHFEVEKSEDGKTFHQVGMVFGVGNTDFKTSYNFNDNISIESPTVIYYRLKLVDIDGRFGYSDIRAIRISKQNETINVVTYPNPVVNDVRVTLPNNWQGKEVNYEIYNASGRLVKNVKSNSASQTETISMTDLNRGMYIVKVRNGAETAVQKIVKN